MRGLTHLPLILPTAGQATMHACASLPGLPDHPYVVAIGPIPVHPGLPQCRNHLVQAEDATACLTRLQREQAQ